MEAQMAVPMIVAWVKAVAAVAAVRRMCAWAVHLLKTEFLWQLAAVVKGEKAVASVVRVAAVVGAAGYTAAMVASERPRMPNVMEKVAAVPRRRSAETEVPGPTARTLPVVLGQMAPWELAERAAMAVVKVLGKTLVPAAEAVADTMAGVAEAAEPIAARCLVLEPAEEEARPTLSRAQQMFISTPASNRALADWLSSTGSEARRWAHIAADHNDAYFATRLASAGSLRVYRHR
jgi:hypothetical protein